MIDTLGYFYFQWGDYSSSGAETTSNTKIRTEFRQFNGNYEDFSFIITFEPNQALDSFVSASSSTLIKVLLKDSLGHIKSYTYSGRQVTKIENQNGSLSFELTTPPDISKAFSSYISADAMNLISEYAVVITVPKDTVLSCISTFSFISLYKLSLKNGKVLAVNTSDIPKSTFTFPMPDGAWRIDGVYNHGYPYIKRFKDIPYDIVVPEEEPINLMDMIRVVSIPHGVNDLFPVTKMSIPLDKPEETKYTLGNSVTKTIVQTTNNTNSELFEQLKKVPKPSSILMSAKNNAANLITQALNGYVTMHQAEGGGCDEIIISSEPDYTEAKNVWRWNLGGLGFSNQGYDAPAEAWQAAITMDGAIVANMITAGTMFADRIRGGDLILGAYDEVDGVLRVMRSDKREIVRMDKYGAYIEGRTISRNESTGFTMVLNDGHIYAYSQYEEGRSDNDQHIVGYIHMTNGVEGEDKLSIGIVSNDGIMLNCQWLGMSDKEGITYIMPEGLQSTDIVTNINIDSEGKVTSFNTSKLWFYNGIYAGTSDTRPFD